MHSHYSQISSYYVFVLTMNQATAGSESARSGGKDADPAREYVLRCTNVDKLVAWLNTLCRAAHLSYDPTRREFTRAARHLRDLDAVIAQDLAQKAAFVRNWERTDSAASRGTEAEALLAAATNSGRRQAIRLTNTGAWSCCVFTTFLD